MTASSCIGLTVSHYVYIIEHVATYWGVELNRERGDSTETGKANSRFVE